MKMSASCPESTHCSLNQGNPVHMMLLERNQFTARIYGRQLEIIITMYRSIKLGKFSALSIKPDLTN